MSRVRRFLRIALLPAWALVLAAGAAHADDWPSRPIRMVIPFPPGQTSSDVFGHPDPEAIAQLVARPGEKSIYFNYETDYTHPWAKRSLRERYDYVVEFGDPVNGHLIVDVR